MPVWVGELITSMICLAAAGVARFVIDALSPGVAPFLLLFPAALIARMCGRGRAGRFSFAVPVFPAWPTTTPPQGLSFKGEAQPANLLAIFAAGVAMIAAAQAFRWGTRRDARERQTKLAERDLML